MTRDEHKELLFLAESWREIATTITNKYAKTSPNVVRHCVATLEARAEEIEEFCQRHKVEGA